MADAPTRIDDYASSMFRFERLHDGWIDRCVTYLQRVFGERIKGATVIDYAFGRGNWSVAFARAGARKVYAIDASGAAVERFSAYCAQEELTAIEARVGNLVEAPSDLQADIVWAYGILHHIAELDVFLPRLAGMAARDDALLFAYAYDKGSLREQLVETARRHALFDSEAAFRAQALKFTPAGRLRARDDLTAPHVAWETAAGLADRLGSFGLIPIGQFPDFRSFDHAYGDAEFSPHHLLLARGGDRIAPAEPARPYGDDVAVLNALWAAAEAVLSTTALTDLAISAFNTHFSHLSRDGDPAESVLQHALLLLYALKSHGAGSHAYLPGAAPGLVALADAALAGTARPRLEGFDRSSIVRRLEQASIRL